MHKRILSNHLSNLFPTLTSRIFQLLFKIVKNNFFFCQIIMGSPLNSKVPKGRNVHSRPKALAQLHSVANDAQCVPPTLPMCL